MKLLAFIFLFSINLYAQNHGTGGDPGPGKDNPKQVYDKQCLDEVVSEASKVVEYYNRYYSEDKNKQILSFLQFLEKIKTLSYKIKFSELETVSEQALRVKCGDQFINKILKENPWLKDQVIQDKVTSIVESNSLLKCKDYGYDEDEIKTYLKFLKVWTQKTSSGSSHE